jgi:hypothetical protein
VPLCWLELLDYPLVSQNDFGLNQEQLLPNSGLTEQGWSALLGLYRLTKHHLFN